MKRIQFHTAREKLLGLLLVLVVAFAIQLPTGDQILLGQQAPATAISAPGTFNFSVTSAGVNNSTNGSFVGAAINLIGTGVEFHKLFEYRASNALTACTYQLEGSTVSSFANTSLIGSVMTCNPSGASGAAIPSAFSSAAQAKFNYVRVHLLTASSNSTVTLSLLYRGYNQDPEGMFYANKTGVISISATTTSIIVAAGTGGIQVSFAGMTVGTTTATAQTVRFGYDTTSTTCASASGFTALTGALSGATNATINGADVNAPTVLQFGNGTGTLWNIPAGSALCAQVTGTQPIGGWVTYKQNN